MLTPEELVAAIKLDEAVKARPSRDEVSEPWATNPLRFAPRDHAVAVATLPKPSRIEKWQRWSCPNAIQPELRLGDTIVDVAYDGTEAMFVSSHRVWMHSMLVSDNWHFLGYARPACVEPGQRWQNRSKGVVEVATVDEFWVTMKNGDRYGADFNRLLSWEYCGMADTASTEKAIKQVATVTGQSVSSVRACVEDIQRWYGEPAQRGAAPAPPPDPAAEARRALEATAKRLIDNPPAWAYPKAWMMAVLREVECRVSAAMLAREFSPRFCFYEELRLYQDRRSAGQTHDAAKAGLNVPELCDVYARGMDVRAKPLLVRPVGIGRVR